MATLPIMRLAGDSAKALPRKLKFTVKAMAAIQPPPEPDARLWVYDTEKPGLALLVTGNDARSFYLARRIHGKPSRVHIGDAKMMTVDQARAEVDRLNGEIVGGVDPAEKRRQERLAGTIGQLWENYKSQHLEPRCSKRTLITDESRFDTCLDVWINRKVSSVTDADVRALHAKIGEDRGHVSANRAVQLLRRMFFWARIEPNPCRRGAVTMFKEETRERFLQPDELPKLFAALDDLQTNPMIRDFIYVCLWTGARRSNVAAMRSEEINTTTSTWTIPAIKSKNAKAMTIPLSAAAMDIVKPRMQDASGFIFPSRGASGHLEDPKATWQDVLQRAGLSDVHLHDLRRTLGSWQAATGASLPIIGRSLGHRDTAATAIYARLNLDPVRASVNTATDAIMLAGGKAKPIKPQKAGGKGGKKAVKKAE